MPDEKNVTLDQLKDFATRADQRLDKLETGKADRVSFVQITIQVDAWQDNTDNATRDKGFLYYADAAVAGVAAKDGAETTLDVASLATAAACGMCGTASTGAGVVRYLAVSVPTEAITAQVQIIQGKALTN